MRIVSKFYDFYDSVQGLGFDASIDYIRTPRDVPLLRTAPKAEDARDKITRDLARSLPRINPLRIGELDLSMIVIGLCGFFSPVIRCNTMGVKERFCYSGAEVDKILYEELKKGSLKRYETYERKRIHKYFNDYLDLINKEPFIINRSPIVILFEKHDMFAQKAIWNGRLKDYQFERIVNPFTTFQMIEMFLANLAEPQKPMPPFPDKAKVQNHGFDKWSFRKKGFKQ